MPERTVCGRARDPVARDLFRRNNFDLIRLVAAAQVLVLHASRHLDVPIGGGGLNWLISLFPGVPIFFFISGFLITSSFESNSSLADYARNRVLRIYPALFVCLVLSTAAVAAMGHLHWARMGGQFLIWLACQLSFFQFFNPDFLRGFGVGVLNGSLWTISVELQFYVLVPMLYAALAKMSDTRIRAATIVGLLLVFMLGNRLYFSAGAVSDSALYRLIGVSFVPWFYMFLLGLLAQRYFTQIHRWVSGKGLYFLSGYVALMALASPLDLVRGNALDPVSYTLLALVVFSCAYTRPELSHTLLRGNDLSYGLYIYHMPVINVLLELGFKGQISGIVLAAVSTALLACGSWFMVERIALKFKRRSMNPLHVGTFRPEKRVVDSDSKAG